MRNVQAATELETETVGWIPCQATPDDEMVPVVLWGKDHWSTLLYLEDMAVNHKGLIDNRRMRCHARRHRPFANLAGGVLMDAAGYPTRLYDGTVRANHDDWDCAYDAAALGYMRLSWTEPVEHESMFGYAQGKVQMLPKGSAIVASLRVHMAEGGSILDFRVEEVETA